MNMKLGKRTRMMNFIDALIMVIKYSKLKCFCTIIINIVSPIVSFFSTTFMLRILLNGYKDIQNTGVLLCYILIMFLISFLLSVAIEMYNMLLLPKCDYAFTKKIKLMIYKKSIEVDLANYENPNTYAVQYRAATQGAEVINITIATITDFITVFVNILLSSWLIFEIDSTLWIFIILPLLLNMINPIISRKLHQVKNEENELNRKTSYCERVFYYSDFAKEMRLSNIHNVIFKYYRESTQQFIKLLRSKGIGIITLMFAVTVATNVLSIIGAETYIVYKTLSAGTILIGDCFVVLSSIGGVTYNLHNLGKVYSKYCDTSLFVKDLDEFMTQQSVIHNDDIKPKAKNGTIEFQNVCFTYPGKERVALENINFCVNPGEKIAIIGQNGSGKTTLIKLLLRLYEPNLGEIKISGKNIKNYEILSYRELFGTVTQDYRYLALSVAENVLGRPFSENDTKEVVSALKLVGLWEKVKKLPKGIHTEVSKEFDENGIVFSGGEFQKLALASIYAKNNDIVILDEPSSSLDPLAEQDMFKTMLTICDSKTVFFISHRVSSAMLADRIIFMNDGKIAEMGSHKELIENHGLYERMYCAQSDDYKND